MQFLFVMDSPQKMIPDKDTSFALIRGAQAREHEPWHCLPTDVFNVGRDVFARARPIRVSDEPPHSALGASSVVELAALDAVFVRRDPPFDAEYMHLTQQLDLVKNRTLVVNDPRGLRDANEKLFAFHFAEFMPRSLVTADRDRILAFVRESGGRAVLKPLDGAGGNGVVMLSTDDRNTRSLIDLLTDEGRRLALAQEYQPAVRAGDKRVLVLDGKLLGAILRVPRDDDLRANIHVGGKVEPTELTEEEERVARGVGERLRAYGLWFSGLDLIGGQLIEVNVTSPTGIQELGRFSGTRPEQEVIQWAEARVADRRKVGPLAPGRPA